MEKEEEGASDLEVIWPLGKGRGFKVHQVNSLPSSTWPQESCSLSELAFLHYNIRWYPPHGVVVKIRWDLLHQSSRAVPGPWEIPAGGSSVVGIRSCWISPFQWSGRREAEYDSCLTWTTKQILRTSKIRFGERGRKWVWFGMLQLTHLWDPGERG